MKPLDPKALQAMYPPMSAEFADRMGRLVHSLPASKEEQKVKRSPIRILLAAALLIAALSTTAYALTRPAVLDWLLPGYSTASPELESTVQDIRAEAAAEGVTIRITGAVYDGAQLALSYEAENADPTQPVLIALDSAIQVNGEIIRLAHPVYTYNMRLVPSPHLDVLPVRRNPVTGGFRADALPEGLLGQVDCAVTFVVYRPDNAFAFVLEPEDPTITDASALAELADSRATLESFRSAVIVEAESAIPAGYTPMSADGSPLVNLEDSRLTEAARITVRFTFDADNAIAYDFSGATAQLADCTVEAVTFRLTPLTTYIRVHLIPAENTEEAARALAKQHGAFTLTDENGAPVQYSEMDAMWSFLPSVACQNGQWLVDYWEELPGLQVFPQSVGFATEGGELLRVDLDSQP